MSSEAVWCSESATMRSGEGFWRKNAMPPPASENITPWLQASSGEAWSPTMSTSASGARGIQPSARTRASPQAIMRRYESGAWRKRRP